MRDAVADVLTTWYRALESEAAAAIEAGDLPAESDPAAIAFQLNSIAMGANQAIQLFGDRQAPERARHAMWAVLGLG